jgi:hypothetical protein
MKPYCGPWSRQAGLRVDCRKPFNLRLTSEFWVSSLIRKVNGTGGYASIIKKGATEAGSIFIVVRHSNGRLELFGPAPQTVYDDKKPVERVFVRIKFDADDAAVDTFLQKERRFDEDLWIVEIEPGNYPVDELLTVMIP